MKQEWAVILTAVFQFLSRVCAAFPSLCWSCLHSLIHAVITWIDFGCPGHLVTGSSLFMQRWILIKSHKDINNTKQYSPHWKKLIREWCSTVAQWERELAAFLWVVVSENCNARVPFNSSLMAKLKPSSVMVQVQPMESEGQKGRIRAELPHVFCCLEHTLLSQLAQDSGFQFDRTLLSLTVIALSARYCLPSAFHVISLHSVFVEAAVSFDPAISFDSFFHCAFFPFVISL